MRRGEESKEEKEMRIHTCRQSQYPSTNNPDSFDRIHRSRFVLE